MATTINASASSGLITTADTSTILQLQTGGTAAVTVDASQNVGIGTSSPLTPLHVVGAIQSQRTGGVSQYARMVNSGGTATFISDNQASGTYTGFQFQGLSTASGTPTTYATIDGSGNVGIGTASPMSVLDVVTSGTTYQRVRSTSGSGSAATYYQNSDTGTTTGDGLYVGIGSDETAYVWNYEATSTVFATSGSERMRIDSSGNLLVGATAAISDERLHVRATTTTGFAFRLYNTQATAGSTFGQYILYSGSSPNGTGNQFLRCDDSTTTRAEIRSNGGIANYSANNVNLASDLRLKHDIEPVQSYWNVFKSIEWKTWLYNDQTDEIKNIGVIAQELQALAPELVCESNALPTPEGESPYLGLWENDFKMAGMSVITELVKRCEEQQAIITSLTDRITALEGTTP